MFIIYSFILVLLSALSLDAVMVSGVQLPALPQFQQSKKFTVHVLLQKTADEPVCIMSSDGEVSLLLFGALHSFRKIPAWRGLENEM